MNLSSKADMYAAEWVELAARHRWAKYFCVGAVSVIYATEYVRRKVCAAAEKLRDSMKAPFRPLYFRALSLLGAFAFCGMVSPFAAAEDVVTVDAIPAAAPSAVREEVVLPKAGARSFDPAASPNKLDEKKRAENPCTVTATGLAAENDDYDIDLDANRFNSDVNAEFLRDGKSMGRIVQAFAGYEISTEDLYIVPYDISIYNTDNRKLDLKKGMTADVRLPLPSEMSGHTEDVRVIRLEDNNTITILDTVVRSSGDGYTVSFTTEHFSTFALVSYNDGIFTENISSAAGMNGNGTMSIDSTVNFSNAALTEDKQRRRKVVRKKIYRIKSIRNERDILL